jgi:branched-subunit amino acid transport protein
MLDLFICGFLMARRDLSLYHVEHLYSICGKIMAWYTCRRVMRLAPHVEDAREERTVSLFVALCCMRCTWSCHSSLVSICMPRYLQEVVGVIVTSGSRSGCCVLTLGFLVKWTKEYLVVANTDPWFLAQSSAFLCATFKARVLCCTVAPEASSDTSSMYPNVLTVMLAQSFRRFAL